MSLRLRLLAAFAYVLVLILVALEIPLALNLSRRIDAEVKEQATGQAHLIAASAAGQLADRESLDRLVRRAAGDLGGRVIVVDSRGILRADSAGAGLRATDYGNRPEIAEALAGRTAQGTRHSETLGRDLLFTSVPIVEEGRRAGAVRVTQSVEAVQTRRRRNVAALIGIGAAALTLGLALAWVLADSLSRPLRRLAATARRVEGGDLEARAEVSGSSEQREVATAFNDMTERLGQALAAQREFVANASHQLRTPLTGLRLRLEAAGLKADDAALRQDLAAAEEEVERLSKLLTSLLTLAREGERPAPRVVAVDECAERARERWREQLEQTGRELSLNGPAETEVLASPEDLAIMLDNLIENALRYSPPRTPIGVEWGRNTRNAFVAVVDEGPGVVAGEESDVFERFARGTGAAGRPGTGLGLAIVRTLARRWGGSARFENRPERGARIEVTLPSAPATKVHL